MIVRKRRSTTYLLLLFTAVACAELLPGSAIRAGDTSTVRIMTWNIRYDNPDDGIHAWPNRRDELCSFIRTQRVDLLCIQEGLHQQVEFLRDGLPGFDVRGVGRDDGREKGEYSAIYFNQTRFSCLEGGTFWLSPTPRVPSTGWDAALPRIVTWTKLHDSLTSTVVVVFNTHFDHVGVQARDSSATLLRQMIAAIAGTAPFILAGDFNSTDSDTPYGILTSHKGVLPDLYDTFNRASTPFQGPLSTFVGFEGNEAATGGRIDYLFVSEKVSVQRHRVIDARRAQGYLSDHLPVLAEISFR